MIYPARRYSPDGEFLGELSAQYLSKKYWERFMDEEKRRHRKSLKFGQRTALQKHIFIENMCDDFMTTEGDY